MNKYKKVWVRGERGGCNIKIGDRVEICDGAPDYRHEGYGIIIANGTENFSWKTAEDWQLFSPTPFVPTIKLKDGTIIKRNEIWLWKEYMLPRRFRNLFGLLIKRFYQSRQNLPFWWENPQEFIECQTENKQQGKESERCTSGI